MTGYKKSACEKIPFRVILFVVCSVISNCIQLLVQDLENACDAPLTALIKVQYSPINSPYLFMANLTKYVIRVQDLIIPGKTSWLEMEFAQREIKQMCEIKKWEFRPSAQTQRTLTTCIPALRGTRYLIKGKVRVIEQAWGQDCWLLAKFFFAWPVSAFLTA